MDHPIKKLALHSSRYKWLIRIQIILVFGWNLQCAILFLLQPQVYAPAFELSPDSIGVTVIRSLGLLFLMWNVPYAFAAIQPLRWKILPLVILIQQFVAVMGEIWILSTLSSEVQIKSSILKFVYFDFSGLVLLTLVYILILRNPTQRGEI